MLVRPLSNTTYFKPSKLSSDADSTREEVPPPQVISKKKELILKMISYPCIPLTYILAYTVFVNSFIYSKTCFTVSNLYTTLKESGLQYKCHIGGTWMNSLQCEVLSGINMILMNIFTDIGKSIFKIGQTRDTTGNLIIITFMYKTLPTCSILKLFHKIHNLNTVVYNTIYEGLDIIYDSILLWNGY